MGVVGKIVDDSKLKLDDLMKKSDELVQQLNSTKGDKTALYEQIYDLKEEIKSLTIESDPRISAFKSAISDINLDNLNFESPEKFAAAIKDMADKTEGAKAAVEEANEAFIKSFRDLEERAEDAKDIKMIEGIIETIQKDTISQKPTSTNRCKT